MTSNRFCRQVPHSRHFLNDCFLGKDSKSSVVANEDSSHLQFPVHLGRIVSTADRRNRVEELRVSRRVRGGEDELELGRRGVNLGKHVDGLAGTASVSLCQLKVFRL